MELFLLAIPLGIFLGWLLKGNLKNLEQAEIKGLFLIFFAFFLRLLVNSPDFAISMGLKNLIPYFPILNVFAYLFLFVFSFLNWKLFSMKFFAFASALNALPIFLNGGKMPFEIREAEKVGLKDALIELSKAGSANIPSNRDAILWPLGDFIPLKGLRYYKLVSIGDIALFFAFALLIAELMRKKVSENP